jgi:hypothetical protein
MKKQWIRIAILEFVLIVVVFAAMPVLVKSDTPTQASGQIVKINSRLDSKPYVIGLGTLTLINAGIAQGKNRKGLNWFLLSLILGPIATFLLVAFFPKLPEIQRVAGPKGREWDHLPT